MAGEIAKLRVLIEAKSGKAKRGLKSFETFAKKAQRELDRLDQKRFDTKDRLEKRGITLQIRSLRRGIKAKKDTHREISRINTKETRDLEREIKKQTTARERALKKQESDRRGAGGGVSGLGAAAIGGVAGGVAGVVTSQLKSLLGPLGIGGIDVIKSSIATLKKAISGLITIMNTLVNKLLEVGKVATKVFKSMLLSASNVTESENLFNVSLGNMS
ncbi:unnamed protein product, partial [marine sediment metagenome]